MSHTQLAFLFGGLSLVVLGASVLLARWAEARRRERVRAKWDELCQRWLAEGKITGYAISSTHLAIMFASNEWLDGIEL